DDILLETLPYGLFTGKLARPVDAERSNRIALHVGPLLAAVEDIIGRDVKERNGRLGAGRGEIGRAVAVDREGGLALAFRLVDLRVSRGIDDKGWCGIRNGLPHAVTIADVELAVREADDGLARRIPAQHELTPELA